MPARDEALSLAAGQPREAAHSQLAAALDVASIANIANIAGGGVPAEEVRRTLRESAIRPVARGGLLPLSFPQQRLWLVERLTSEGSAYHIPYVFRLRGSRRNWWSAQMPSASTSWPGARR